MGAKKKIVVKKPARKVNVRKRIENENGLTEFEQHFCDEYLSNGFLARRAYDTVRPGRVGAKGHASNILKRAKVKKYIAGRHKAIAEKSEITHEKIISELGKIAFFDPKRLFDERGAVKDFHKLDPDVATAVKLILSNTKEQTIEINVSNKIKALEALLKVVGAKAEETPTTLTQIDNRRITFIGVGADGKISSAAEKILEH